MSRHTAVVTNCTNRKRFDPLDERRARALAKGAIADMASEWSARRVGAPSFRSSELYCGRSYQLAASAAAACQGRLYAVSAGYGLVADDDQIPSYSITVSGNNDDNVVSRSSGGSAKEWWNALPPLRLSLCNLRACDLALFALSEDYLTMVEDDLEALRQEIAGTLLIFASSGAAKRLRPSLSAHVMPYGSALEGPGSPCKGTGTDAAQRRLLHFVRDVAPRLPGGFDVGSARGAVATFAAAAHPSARKHGRSTSDDDIMRHVVRAKALGYRSQTAVLRYLRRDMGIACEQSRFRTLFLSAL